MFAKSREYSNLYKIVLSAILFTLFFECCITLVENNLKLQTAQKLMDIPYISIHYFSIKQAILLFVVFLVIFYIYFNPTLKEKTLTFIYKYRFLIGLAIILLSTLLQIHGSSLAQLTLSDSNHKSLLGIARNIRSDEFNVNTPLAFSQYYNNFSYFSEIVRGTTTDMFITYGQPVWNLAVIFRPFQIGYLFLPQGYGLSFYWVSRLVILFLISFEFGMLLTNKNKILSLAYTFLIAFSPIVQQWYAINMLVEMLIFGQAIILLINYYMETNNYKKRLLTVIPLIICAGGFILGMYPAWEIPLAYVFLALLIWIVYKNWNSFRYSKKDFLIILLTILILAISLCYIFLKSFDAIQLILNTAYPGSRKYYGGLLEGFNYAYIFKYLISWAVPFVGNIDGALIDPPSFISFFPLGFIIYLIVRTIQKRRDFLSTILIVLFVCLFAYFLIPMPHIIGDITFLKSTTPSRLIAIFSFINLLLLIRAMALYNKEINTKKLKIAALIASILISAIGLTFVIPYLKLFNYKLIVAIITFVIFTILYYFIFNGGNKKFKKYFLIGVVILTLIAGGLFNPIETGTDFYFKEPIVQQTATIVQNNPNETWIVENGINIDSIIPVGAHTLNSVNTYPQMETWHKIDSAGEFNDTYNRYAHITINLQNNSSTTFELLQPDIFNINLNVSDLETLNITYVLTPRSLENLSNEHVQFIELYKDERNFTIYEIKYS